MAKRTEEKPETAQRKLQSSIRLAQQTALHGWQIDESKHDASIYARSYKKRRGPPSYDRSKTYDDSVSDEPKKSASSVFAEAEFTRSRGFAHASAASEDVVASPTVESQKSVVQSLIEQINSIRPAKQRGPINLTALSTANVGDLVIGDEQTIGFVPSSIVQEVTYETLSIIWWLRKMHQPIDLSGLNLTGIRLVGEDLSEVNFSSCILRGANFSGSVMGSADFKQAQLQKSNFSGAELSGASFRNADLSGANLGGAGMWFVDFENTVLTGSIFEGGSIRASNLHSAIDVPENAMLLINT